MLTHKTVSGMNNFTGAYGKVKGRDHGNITLEEQEQPPYSAGLEMSRVHSLSLGTENKLEMKW